MKTAEDIQELIRGHLTSEVVCAPLSSDDPRVGCVVPLEYPSGDDVSVWIEPTGVDFYVTDYGEALADSLSRPAQDHKALVEQAERIARLYGLRFDDERLTGQARESTLGETIWRVAAASAQIAQVSAAFKPRKHKKTKDFAREVERDLKSHDLDVEREHTLEGASGHEYHVALFLPASETIMEPVSGGGNWTQVSTVYTRLNDLAKANGFTPCSLVDDRQRPLEDDFVSMLTQVGDVLAWSRRSDWIGNL